MNSKDSSPARVSARGLGKTVQGPGGELNILRDLDLEIAAGEAVVETMRALAEELGPAFRLMEGKMVCELMPAGRSKGKAIEDFMAVQPFAGRLPVFLGDDITDEAGFSVVNELGGHSVHVRERARETGTLARWSLPDIEAVYAWLGELADS